MNRQALTRPRDRGNLRKAWLAREEITEAGLEAERVALTFTHWPGPTGSPPCGAPMTAPLGQRDQIDCPVCRKLAGLTTEGIR